MVALVPKAKSPFKKSATKTGFIGTFIEPEKMERVNARAALVAKGNRSDYLRDLLEKDIDGHAPGYDEAVLATLARIYGGYFAPRLDHLLAEQSADQPRILHDLLAQFCEALACGYKPSELTVAPKICTTWRAVDDSMRQPIVAEEQAPYQSADEAKQLLKTLEAAAEAAHRREGKHPARGTKPPTPGS